MYFSDDAVARWKKKKQSEELSIDLSEMFMDCINVIHLIRDQTTTAKEFLVRDVPRVT